MEEDGQANGVRGDVFYRCILKERQNSGSESTLREQRESLGAAA